MANARRTMGTRPAFVAAQEPAANKRRPATRPGDISPAGLGTIRRKACARRGKRWFGTVVTCEWCGVEFCPLVAAARRRSSTR